MIKTLFIGFTTAFFLLAVTPIGAEAADSDQKTTTLAMPSSESRMEQPTELSETRRNGMSLELLGRGLLYSLNYDYLIHRDLALGIGAANYSFSAGSSSASAWIIPVYANYYLTEGKHRWFATGGANVILASSTTGATDSRVTGSGVAGVIGGGYEFKSNGGFLFRAAPYVFVGKASGAWLGVSFGYAI